MINIIILRLKLFFAYLCSTYKYDLEQLGKKNIFIFLGADYGNVGDVAITYAQTKYLQERYPTYNVVEIPISQTFNGIKAVKRVVGKNDIIALIGGGNTSDLYDDIEWLRQLVVLNFRNQRIIGFPQTFDFSNTLKGYFCKSIAHYVYGKARCFTILTRERNTMRMLQRDMKNLDTQMAPDIVMTLDERCISDRHGALVCLRSDKEKAIKEGYRRKLITKLQQKYGNITYQDTQVDGVSKSNRYDKLRNIIDLFRQHELVVTDRLHGMILCFVTGTPALVLDNSNHKISACYEWIKDCGYIKLLSSLEDVDSLNPIYKFDEVHKKIMSYYENLSCLKFH